MTETWKFGEWLGQTMRERGISQAQLARDLGVSQSAVSRWLAGKTGIDNASLQAVSAYFGVPAGVLLPLTGLRVSNDDDVHSAAERMGLSPEEEADLAKFRAKWDYLHAKYPRPFWSVIDRVLDAWDATTERSLELLRSEDTEPPPAGRAGQRITGGESNANESLPKKARGAGRPRRGRLTELYAGAM